MSTESTPNPADHPNTTPSPDPVPSAAPDPNLDLVPSAASEPDLVPSAAPEPDLVPSAAPDPNLDPSAASGPNLVSGPSAAPSNAAEGTGRSVRKLERRYPRVLRVYPAGQRRGELLDTLLEISPPDRTWPTARETTDLLRRGLRARLGRPTSRAVVVLAVMIALVTGYTAAAFAVRGTWEAAPGFPTGDRLTTITGTIFPGLPVNGERDAPGLFHDISEPSTLDVIRGGHDEDFTYATYQFGPSDLYVKGDYHAWTTETVRRLTEAGWTVHDTSPTGPTLIATGGLDESGSSITAQRDGLTIEISAETDVVGTPPGSFYALATLTREPPWYVAAAGALGTVRRTV